VSLLTDKEILAALKSGFIQIDPFDESECLQGSSYDMRLGNKAIVSKVMTLEELRSGVESGEVKELNLQTERSLSVPAGAFSLAITYERIRLSVNYAGHIGLGTYYARKGLMIMSGLQIDPGWDGHLVLGLANLSPRTITIDYMDQICTIEIHKLADNADRLYTGPYMKDQRQGKIPTADKDYLRTIETMSSAELTRALLSVSQNLKSLTKWIFVLWIPVGIVIIAKIILDLFLR
jgi:dCTP deaminase